MHISAIQALLVLGSLLLASSPVASRFAPETRQDQTQDDSTTKQGLQTSDYTKEAPKDPRNIFLRHFLTKNIRGYCFKRLALAPAPGTPSGFKGWRRNHSSGYIVLGNKLFLVFKCDKKKRHTRRVKRTSTSTEPPPRPCVQGVSSGEGSSSGSGEGSSSGSGEDSSSESEEDPCSESE